MATAKEIHLCQEIIAIAIAVNSQEKYSVWCEFSGHVNDIEVTITPKWFDGARPLDGWSYHDKHCYLSENGDSEQVIEENIRTLEMIKAELVMMLEGGE